MTVWWGITSSKIIGPYFFQDITGNLVTDNVERYWSMIQKYLIPKLAEMGLQKNWFHQDGATAHTARETMAMLKAFSGIASFHDLKIGIGHLVLQI